MAGLRDKELGYDKVMRVTMCVHGDSDVLRKVRTR